jgi:hypothetical protein
MAASTLGDQASAYSAELTPLSVPDSARRRAGIVVCSQAQSADEARELLDMLGLRDPAALPQPASAPPAATPPAPARRVTEPLAKQPAQPAPAPPAPKPVKRQPAARRTAQPRTGPARPRFDASKVRIQPYYPVICQKCGPVGEPPTTREAANRIRAAHLWEHRQPKPATPTREQHRAGHALGLAEHQKKGEPLCPPCEELFDTLAAGGHLVPGRQVA